MQSHEGENGSETGDQHAEAWLGRYQERLDRVLNSGTSKLDDVADVLWEEGVLGRIAPLSPDEKSARAGRGKAVWERNIAKQNQSG